MSTPTDQLIEIMLEYNIAPKAIRAIYRVAIATTEYIDWNAISAVARDHGLE